MNLAIIGVVVAIWQLSKRDGATAYAVGMVLYLLDALIFLLVRDWVGVGFHAFFLALLWGGYGFVRQQHGAEQALAQPQIAPESQTSPA